MFLPLEIRPPTAWPYIQHSQNFLIVSKAFSCLVLRLPYCTDNLPTHPSTHTSPTTTYAPQTYPYPPNPPTTTHSHRFLHRHSQKPIHQHTLIKPSHIPSWYELRRSYDVKEQTSTPTRTYNHISRHLRAHTHCHNHTPSHIPPTHTLRSHGMAEWVQRPV